MPNNLTGKGLRTAGDLEPTLATLETAGGGHVPRYLPLGEKLPDYDAKVMGYDGSGRLVTITYKTGGVSGTTVAVRTLVYVASGPAEGEIESDALVVS